MDNLLGKWKLVKNEGFDKFLKFTQISWYKRKIAEYSPINIEIERLPMRLRTGGYEYEKRVRSTFYKTDERITFNDEYVPSGTTRRKYTLTDDGILVDIIGSIVNWNERIYYEEPNLIVEYSWKEGTVEKFARQIFS